MRRVTRRAVLGSISTTAVATGIAAGADNKKEIVTDKTGDNPLHTETVSEDWLVNIRAARRAQERLENLFSSDLWVESIGRKNSNELFDGLAGQELVVEISDKGTIEQEISKLARREIPNEINGLPIKTEEKTPEEEVHYDDHVSGGWCNSSKVDCVQGGDLVSARYADGDGDCSDTWGTLSTTCAVKKDGKEYLMTSAHGFVSGTTCGTDITDQAAGQGHACNDGTQLMGHVVDYDHGQDWALIENDIQLNISSKVRDTGRFILGHVTEDGLDYINSNNEIVYKHGARTCWDSGRLERTYSDSRCGERNTWVEVTTQAGGGDSGSPHYRTINTHYTNYLSLIGPHVWHTTNGGDHESSRLPAAFDIHDKNDIVFGKVEC